MNDSAEKTLYRVVELAEKFGVKDTTIRKYITDFEIPHTKDGRKTLLDEEAVTLLTEILKLKESGMTLKKIKEIRQAQIQAESKTTTVEKEKQEPAKSQPQKQEKVETPEPSQVKEEPKAEPQIKKEARKETKNEAKPEKKRKESRKKEQEETNTSNTVDKKEDKNKEYTQRNNTVLTRDYIGKEITNQSRKVSKINRQLSSNVSLREKAEMETSLNLRFSFLAGLRYIRDNWLSDKKAPHKDS